MERDGLSLSEARSLVGRSAIRSVRTYSHIGVMELRFCDLSRFPNVAQCYESGLIFLARFNMRGIVLGRRGVPQVLTIGMLRGS